jgi:hypothetical protein
LSVFTVSIEGLEPLVERIVDERLALREQQEPEWPR